MHRRLQQTSYASNIQRSQHLNKPTKTSLEIEKDRITNHFESNHEIFQELHQILSSIGYSPGSYCHSMINELKKYLVLKYLEYDTSLSDNYIISSNSCNSTCFLLPSLRVYQAYQVLIKLLQHGDDNNNHIGSIIFHDLPQPNKIFPEIINYHAITPSKYFTTVTLRIKRSRSSRSSDGQ